MVRPILEETKVHPAVRASLAENHVETVREVQQAVESNPVVVVGMAQNPFPRRARAALEEKRIPFKYLEYGSYLSEWRRRTALKMWTGWPTFPMIFVRGSLVGGFEDLKRLIQSGELERMLQS
jgi:monothiol glutaredoxin